jgi:hypothetical protein
VRTLILLAVRNEKELQRCSGNAPAGTIMTMLSDLPHELVAMIVDRLLQAHMAEARTAALALALVEETGGSCLVGFDLPLDWRSRVITTPPAQGG